MIVTTVYKIQVTTAPSAWNNKLNQVKTQFHHGICSNTLHKRASGKLQTHLWYVWDTNILQGQHYNQTSPHETQGPGP